MVRSMKRLGIISIIVTFVSLVLVLVSLAIYKPFFIYNKDYEMDIKLSEQEFEYYKSRIDEKKTMPDDGLSLGDYKEYEIYKNHETKLRCLYSKDGVLIFVDEKSGGPNTTSLSIVENEMWFINPENYSQFYIFVDGDLTDDSSLYYSDLFHEVKSRYWIWLYLK